MLASVCRSLDSRSSARFWSTGRPSLMSQTFFNFSVASSSPPLFLSWPISRESLLSSAFACSDSVMASLLPSSSLRKSPRSASGSAPRARSFSSTASRLERTNPKSSMALLVYFLRERLLGSGFPLVASDVSEARSSPRGRRASAGTLIQGTRFFRFPGEKLPHSECKWAVSRHCSTRNLFVFFTGKSENHLTPLSSTKAVGGGRGGVRAGSDRPRP